MTELDKLIQKSMTMDRESDKSGSVNYIKNLTPTTPWWEATSLPGFGAHTLNEYWVELGLGILALIGAPPVMSKSFSGVPTKGVVDFIEKMTALGCRAVATPERGSHYNITRGSWKFIWVDGFLSVDFDSESFCSVSLVTNNEHIFNSVHDICSTELNSNPIVGKVYVVIQTEYGLDFEPMTGIAGQELIRGNYSKEVLESYDKVVDDLNNKDPIGRLIVLNGPPGCGKTTSIKGLINDVPDCLFIIVPPRMLAELGSPQVLPSLIQLRKSKGKKNIPFCFIVEDSDTVLVNREIGDMSAISAVLNLSSGIIGSLLDIRIIATTNQNAIDIDPALLRKGRLSARIEIQPLPRPHALEVLKRLCGDDAELPDDKNEFTLAEVYGISKDGKANATGVVEKKTRKVGFGS